MIQVDHLIHEYPGKRALNDVSFQVREGSITALVGPNGSGKTTLMRCIAALEVPFSGSIRIGDTDVLEHPRRAHEQLGYLSDFFGLYEELTVAQCLLFAARLHRLDESAARQRISWVTERLELAPWLAQRAGNLSRGWKQRVGIAFALLHKPRLLLLDEPASGLDPEARIVLSSLLRTLRDEGMTILVSSHILAELEDYCTDMLVLRQGKVIEHRFVSADSAPKLHIEIGVLDATDAVEALLAGYANVSDMQVQPGKVTIAFSGAPSDQHALLTHLMGNAIPVSSFAVKPLRLQDVYISLTREGNNV